MLKSKMLPAKLASKIGVYDVTIHNMSVKVRVVDHIDVVMLGLSELKSDMGKNMVIGIMIKDPDAYNPNPPMMVLCGKSRCLVIQLCLLKSVPQCLIGFLNDKEICFVGAAMNETLTRLFSHVKTITPESNYNDEHFSFKNSTCIDVGDLAAKVLQDPTILSNNWEMSKIFGPPMESIADKLSNKREMSKTFGQYMESIADKAGVAFEKGSIEFAHKSSIDLSALAFSRLEIKHLVVEAFASYIIATKLVESL